MAAETARHAAHRLAAGALAEGFKPETLHTYKSPEGDPLYYRIRARHPDGRKWIRPMKLNGTGYVLGEPEFPNGKPIYKLDQIAARSGDPVWITEGEKAADKIGETFGVLATTSGSATSAVGADWSPLFGRACILWPDNDEAGESYISDVATILERMGVRYSVIDISGLGLPPGGDVVDWVQEHPQAALADLHALPTVSSPVAVEDGSEPELDREIAVKTAKAVIADAIVKAGTDPGAMFEVDVVEALRLIRQTDTAAFMRLRAAIKKIPDVKIKELDDAIAGADVEVERATADALIHLARDRCELFHDPDGSLTPPSTMLATASVGT